MTGDVHYDEEAAAREAAAYRTETARRRRAFVRDRLDPAPGETVASVGCGPGFEPAELADVVGPQSGAWRPRSRPTGTVLGIDTSDAMLDLSRERCADCEAVTLLRGSADALPLAANSLDGALAVQVLEYVPDPGAALAELARALRPGGRAVLLDTDWRTLVWRADDEERCADVLRAWERQCPNPRIGSDLAGRASDASLTVESVDPFPIAQRSLDGTFAGQLVPFLADHAADQSDIGPERAAAWREDVLERDQRGETFVSLTQYCYVVTAPDQ